jgi:hypothetical protein
MAQAKGAPQVRKAASTSPSGSKKGMAVGPHKPTAKLANPAKPVIDKNPIAGVKTNPKAQPMYTGKSSKAGKMVDQYGYGLIPGKGVGYQDQAHRRTAYGKTKYNQG